ncbi:carboxypeptidase regulatory-like domain-containing protein [Pengzhenrongella sicca]|uniref:Carboxypeptidase regulatory-like domain-containing protein n=1 Tax=Pengzhenrongella sicca TaxID=2819238 RepID=A0A8A4ZDW1_9MICO|nr:carboxypeptidase regulatory-like domain-containing protein [Pengzhenrongella sicca]QTE29093.1 carboxypeptidase regulatory-like domain-containing protein [Pengzhenrongella sicca]
MAADDVAAFALEPLGPVDTAILDDLAALWGRLDPVPADLVDRIGLALTLDALETELAQIHRVASPALAVRADETSIEAETITFTTDVLTVMITVHAEGEHVRIDGWSTPAGQVSVELHQGSTVTTTESDENGRFVLADVARGAARLVLRRAAAPQEPVVTPMIEL